MVTGPKFPTKSPGNSGVCLERDRQLNTLPQMTKKHPTNIYLFNVNNNNTRKRCNICSKLTIKTPERRYSMVLDTMKSTFGRVVTDSYLVQYCALLQNATYILLPNTTAILLQNAT